MTGGRVTNPLNRKVLGLKDSRGLSSRVSLSRPLPMTPAHLVH